MYKLWSARKKKKKVKDDKSTSDGTLSQTGACKDEQISTGSSVTRKAEIKEPTNSKLRKGQSNRAGLDSSSDTDSSSESRDSSGYKHTTKKVYKNEHGGTTMISKQFKVGGNYINIQGVNNTVVNIIKSSQSSQPKPNVTQKSEIKSRYEPYNDETKEAFFGRSKVRPAHGIFTHTQEGSHFRVVGVDNSKLIVTSERSICRIQYPQGHGISHGSGFRIGPPGMNLILTAGHILEHILKCNEPTIFDQQTDMQQANNLARGDVWCVFNHDTDDYRPDEKYKFYFKPVIHFNDPKTDTTILELKPNEHDTPMPPSFTRFCMPEPTKPFYLIGHPAGGKKKSCLSDPIIDMESDITSNHIIQVRRWCEDRNLTCEPSNDHRLNNPARWLFHVPEDFMHGASGCPGLVFNPPHGISVVTVFLGGYPHWFYDGEASSQHKAELPQEYRVEQGANILAVLNNLETQNRELYNKLKMEAIRFP